MRTVLFIALRHLHGRKRQTTVAVLGMALSVTILVTMTGLMKGFEHKFLSETLKISPHALITDQEVARSKPLALRALGERALVRVRHERPTDRPGRIERPGEVVAAARQLPGVVAGAQQLIGRSMLAFGDKTYPVEMRGIEPAHQDEVTPVRAYVTDGRFEALSVASDGIMLGSGVAEKLGAVVGDRITSAATSGARAILEVVAIFDTGIPGVDRNLTFVLLRTAQAILRRPDEVNAIGFRFAEPERAPELAAVIQNISGHVTESWQQQNANWIGIFAFNQLVTQLVVGFLLTVAAFGILNILVMIVLEKSRDIAILRSVGLTRSTILRIFLVQGLLMGLAGATLGSLLGAVAVWGLEKIPLKMVGLVTADHILMRVEPWYYGAATLFAVGAGLVASILPARRAAATEPVDVLRGTT